MTRRKSGAEGATVPLLSAAALVEYIQAGREGGRAFLVFVVCFGSCIFPFAFLPEYVGGRGCKPFSTLGGGACGLYTSVTEGQARGFFLCASALVFSIRIFHEVMGVRGASASLLSAAALLACMQAVWESGRAIFFWCASALVFSH